MKRQSLFVFPERYLPKGPRGPKPVPQCNAHLKLPPLPIPKPKMERWKVQFTCVCTDFLVGKPQQLQYNQCME